MIDVKKPVEIRWAGRWLLGEVVNIDPNNWVAVKFGDERGLWVTTLPINSEDIRNVDLAASQTQAADSILPNAKWDQIEHDVMLRLLCLRHLCRGLSNNEVNRKIVNDLVLPNLALLGEFCQNVKVEG